MSTSAFGEPINGIHPPADYKPGQTRVPMILGFTASYFVLAFSLVSMRFYVRKVLLKAWGIDDWFLLGALMSVLGFMILGLWATTVGLGTRLYDIVKDGGDPQKLYWFRLFSPIFYHASGLLIQLCILTFYLRLSFTRNLRIATHVLMVVAVLNSMVPLLTSTISGLIRGTASAPNVQVLRGLWYANASGSLVIDFCIVCLPLPTLWKLKNLNIRKKIALMATFSVGLIGCVALIVRLCLIEQASQIRGDTSWDAVLFHILCMTEGSMGLSCASMAALRPLLVRWGILASSGAESGAAITPGGLSGGGTGQPGRKSYLPSTSGSKGIGKSLGKVHVLRGLGGGDIYAGGGSVSVTVNADKDSDPSNRNKGTKFRRGDAHSRSRSMPMGRAKFRSSSPSSSISGGSSGNIGGDSDIELGNLKIDTTHAGITTTISGVSSPSSGSSSSREHVPTNTSGAGNNQGETNPFSRILQTITIETRRERIGANGVAIALSTCDEVPHDHVHHHHTNVNSNGSKSMYPSVDSLDSDPGPRMGSRGGGAGGAGYRHEHEEEEVDPRSESTVSLATSNNRAIGGAPTSGK